MKKEERRGGAVPHYADFPAPKKSRHLSHILIRRGITVLLVLLQLTLWVMLLVTGAVAFRFLFYFFTVLSLLSSLYVLTKETETAYKLLWIFFLLLFPIPALAVFLPIEARGYRRRLPHHSSLPVRETPGKDVSAGYETPFRLLQNAGFAAFSTHSVYYPSGKDKIAALIRVVEQAESYIYLEYFIIDEGFVFEKLLSVLLRKVEEGVDVRILMDDIGCFLLRPRHFARLLRRAGIRVAVFNTFSPYITAAQNYRDHRKIAVIDDRIAFMGGVNLADEYAGIRRRFGHWKDVGISIEGDAAAVCKGFFLEMWNAAKKIGEKKTSSPSPVISCIPSSFRKSPPLRQFSQPPNGTVLPFISDPFSRVLRDLWLSVIHTARERLYITTPYLILSDAFLSALTVAARSGVDVRIVVPSIPDKPLIYRATKSYYKPLIEAGVSVYEYTPGFIHAKLLFADECVAVVGSGNLDYRSLCLSYESGVCLYGSEPLKAIAADFGALFDISHRVEPREVAKGPAGLIAPFLRLFAPLM